MDPNTISVLAGAAVSLLVPYCTKLAEEMTSGVGGKMADAAWDKAKELYSLVRQRFTSSPEALKVFDALEKTPQDTDTQAAVRFHLKSEISNDETLGQKLATLLKEADQAGVDAVFNTTIHGNIEKFTQVGVVYGDVNT